jgi:hypothetical protein
VCSSRWRPLPCPRLRHRCRCRRRPRCPPCLRCGSRCLGRCRRCQCPRCPCLCRDLYKEKNVLSYKIILWNLIKNEFLLIIDLFQKIRYWSFRFYLFFVSFFIKRAPFNFFEMFKTAVKVSDLKTNETYNEKMANMAKNGKKRPNLTLIF